MTCLPRVATPAPGVMVLAKGGTDMLQEVDTSGRPRQVYCGPYAIAALTGLSIAFVEDQINFRREKKFGSSVRWTNGHDLHFVGRQAHLQMGEFEKILGAKTFARWLRERTPEQVKSKYLVLVTGHWVAVEGRKMIDNITRTPTFIRKAPHRRKKVQVVIKVG